MTRDEFTSLPLALALGVLYDVASKRLQDVPAQRAPLPPKFDSKLFRKGGFVWCSEVTLNDLRYWHKRAAEGAAKGGQYAEKDAKNAKSLGYWVAWRACFPDAVWAGERDRVQVTAAPPSNEPELRDLTRQEPVSEATYDFNGSAADPPDDYNL